MCTQFTKEDVGADEENEKVDFYPINFLNQQVCDELRELMKRFLREKRSHEISLFSSNYIHYVE